VELLPYKKIVAWCGTIPLCKEWYDEINKFKNRYPNLENLKLFMDLSIKNDKNIKNYKKFKKISSNGIMLCAQKHREGSDILNLDCCIFLDKVKNRGSIPFIQSIGRVLRLDPKNIKNNGIVIDGVVRDENDYEKNMVDKILGYYFALHDIANIDDITIQDKEDSSYNKYITLKNIVKFDADKKIIILNFNKTKITINCKKLDWKNIINKFDIILEQKFIMNPDEQLRIEFERLKEHIENKKFTDMKIYQKYAKTKNLELNPKIKYNIFWLNYCDFLNIDSSCYYKTKESIKKICKKYNIITQKKYSELVSNNFSKIPKDPCDYYNVKNFNYFINKEEEIFCE
jgi:hypothetical protein